MSQKANRPQRIGRRNAEEGITFFGCTYVNSRGKRRSSNEKNSSAKSFCLTGRCADRTKTIRRRLNILLNLEHNCVSLECYSYMFATQTSDRLLIVNQRISTVWTDAFETFYLLSHFREFLSNQVTMSVHTRCNSKKHCVLCSHCVRIFLNRKKRVCLSEDRFVCLYIIE